MSADEAAWSDISGSDISGSDIRSRSVWSLDALNLTEKVNVEYSPLDPCVFVIVNDDIFSTGGLNFMLIVVTELT